jgi:hypothetical protein
MLSKTGGKYMKIKNNWCNSIGKNKKSIAQHETMAKSNKMKQKERKEHQAEQVIHGRIS